MKKSKQPLKRISTARLHGGILPRPCFGRCLSGASAVLFISVLLLIPLPVASAQPLPIGSRLPEPDRVMPDVRGDDHIVGEVVGESGLVLAFWSNSCPWIDRYEDRFLETVNQFSDAGIGFALVNANDPVAMPEDAPEQLVEQAEEGAYTFPYLMDANGALARSLGALRTPEVFVFDDQLRLVYSGAIDDSPAIADAVSNPHLNNALEALVNGEEVSVDRTNAIGCTIKFAPE